MCKLLLIPYVPPETNYTDLWAFARAMRMPMTKNDKDGFGYMALSKDARALTVQKWASPSDAFAPSDAKARASLSRYAGLIEEMVPIEETSLRFGPRVEGRAVNSLMLHSRMATSAKGLMNAHPHYDAEIDTEIAIVHNGVMQQPMMINTQCDSEHIVWSYLDGDAAIDPAKVPKMTKTWGGWWAVGAYLKQYDGRFLADVLRDSSAQLTAVYVNQLRLTVFATSVETVIAACRSLHWKGGVTSVSVRSNHFMRVDPVTGAVVASGALPEKVISLQHYSSKNGTDGYWEKNLQGPGHTWKPFNKKEVDSVQSAIEQWRMGGEGSHD